MVTEIAVMSIVPGREEEFLAALEQAKEVLREAPGWVSVDVHRGVERPSCFLLAIRWRTLADHTEGFRGGELFVRWRGILGPFFAEPPQVEHWLPS